MLYSDFGTFCCVALIVWCVIFPIMIPVICFVFRTIRKKELEEREDGESGQIFRYQGENTTKMQSCLRSMSKSKKEEKESKKKREAGTSLFLYKRMVAPTAVPNHPIPDPAVSFPPSPFAAAEIPAVLFGTVKKQFRITAVFFSCQRILLFCQLPDLLGLICIHLDQMPDICDHPFGIHAPLPHLLLHLRYPDGFLR